MARKTARELYRKAETMTVPAEVTTMAETLLFLDTLEERGSDSLDFHDTSVASIRALLALAFEAGQKAARAEALPALQEVRKEIRRLNMDNGGVVFNHDATRSLDAVIKGAQDEAAEAALDKARAHFCG